MSRAVRITVGSVLVGVLAFVALVAGIMSASSGVAGDLLGDLSTAGVDTPATAEVLDVDDYGDGWPTVDVRWTTPEDEVVVTYVDWEWSDELPEVGDSVEVLYDDQDPEYAFAADDPWLADGASMPQDEGSEADAGEAGATGEVAGWVALASLAGVVVGAVVTVVAAVRAPVPAPTPYQPTPYEAPHPHLAGAGGPYAQQPYAQQPYAQQPYAQQPYAQQPYGQQPSYGGQPAVPLQGHEPAAGPAAGSGSRWPHPG